MLEKIKVLFAQKMQTQISAEELLPTILQKAALIICHSLLNGNKILSSGSGFSSVHAQYFTDHMMHGFKNERPSLPSISVSVKSLFLPTMNNDQGFNDIEAKQIRALGKKGDVLLAISTYGNCGNIVKAVETAMKRGMIIVALTGHAGGVIASLLGQQDIEIRIPSDNHARIEEMHMFIVHCLCELIEDDLFPKHG
ncbi:DnaA initiator-associating protein DiaA [Candidatus Erwinia haradaeae]|uniref:DnaA initiator-associating protein DiaA n=1 Tax=Candidatus Erwinia haradaeae TaxID=1922217 RepID=A0A451DD92_9GAMM|nr:SIS domain-containing protein [Candidatus Erwinia haradaeae]VFP84379.1 DnaA initiator-associating protein DiaA [Candidatus Erwinia haradaeae]